MFGKAVLISSVILASLSIACADPNYVSEKLPPSKSGGTNCMARFRDGDCVSFSWERVPNLTERKVGSFVFSVFSESKMGPVPVDMNGDMTVHLWMPSMGHEGSPVTVTKLATGEYRADQVFFTMHGHWEIYFELKLERTVLDTAIVEIDFFN